ncbi:MAG: DUF4132 domain-containing protein [Gemmataceae bacterium]|nr:DUF4132 domain-containing protein [Gemmataceae bacterium]
MLKPEIAREQLEKLKSKKHAEGRNARLRKLSKPLAGVAFGLSGKQADGKFPKEWSERQKLQKASAIQLSGDAKARGKVFAALFPTFHAEVEAGWQLLTRLPYTAGYNRRAFRAPGRPAMYHDRRQSFLESLLDTVEHLPDDTLTADWLAAWAVHLGWRSDPLGYLFAGVIDQNGPAADSVFTILKDSAANRHEVGGPGGHATRGLLCCARPEAWDFVESLLLAAQRQEGLRQSILEAVDEAHPQAFGRMVGILLDQNLIRFASVARAAGVWLGEEEEVENPKKLKADLLSIREMLADPAARQKAIAKGDAVAAYRALWAIAFEDAEDAVQAATPLFKDKAPARRFAAAKLAMETDLPEVAHLMLPLLHDADLRLVSLAVHYAAQLARSDEDDDEDATKATPPANLFEQLEKVIPNLPEKQKELKAPVDGWSVPDIGQEDAADALLGCLGNRPAERLLPYLPLMGEYARVHALAKLCEPRTLTTKVRQTLLAIAGETNRYVREAAMGYLKKCKLAEDEAQTLEGYLTRKTADFRRSVFALLLNRADKLVLDSIDRLLAAGDANSRAAGIELTRRMVDGERSAEVAREKLRTYRDGKGKRLAAGEAQAIEVILNPAARPPTLEDGLGTFDPAERSPVVEPKKRKVKFATPAAVAFIQELDAFIHEHRDRTFVDTREHRENEEHVLGSIRYRWLFPSPDISLTIAEDRKHLPLLELWEQWWSARSAKTRDGDGMELLRASMLSLVEVREGEEGEEDTDDWDDDDDDDESKKEEDPAVVAAREQIVPIQSVKVRYDAVIESLIGWFLRLYPPTGAPDFLLDAAETALALVPPLHLDKVPRTEQDESEAEDNDDDDDKNSAVEWREDESFVRWLSRAQEGRQASDWTEAHDARLFRLCRWLDEPVPGARRKRPDLAVLLAGYRVGAATLADFYDHLIGPRAKERWSHESFESVRWLTQGPNKSYPLVDEKPELRAAVDTVVDRIIEIELARGETPTAATKAATEIGQVVGVGRLLDLIAALGKHGFTKPPSYGHSENKPAVLTTLIQHCVPLPGDAPESFAAEANAAVAAGRFESERIAELGLVNPRWVQHVAAAIRWPGYEEAVYWFIAHTRNSWENALGGETEEDDSDNDEETPADEKQKPDDPWQTIVKARTNLTAEQRADGLIDVAWFHQAYAAVGNDRRWDAIEAAAKFLGYGQAHKKAARLADVLLDRTKKKDLVAEIRTKNLKESVRLLGLLPLPDDAVKLEAELSDRYKVLKEYERYARGLSALSKEPALQAARLGLENLAVTAGFPDPVRLEWAVTAREVADLGHGPVTVAVKGISVSLALTSLAEVEVTQTKDGKPLKSLPSDVRKIEKVAELLERKKALARTASNTKRSLEQAMCAGDRFRGAELKSLMGHALVRPLLDRLVLKTAAGMGYPAKGGSALKSWDGKTVPLKANDEWTIAHPLDFVDSGDWHEWQAECFRAERLQPFKQVFREVYIVTPAEKADGDQSRRYSGQQVNETQAKALFGTRGWSTRDGISKLYRDANLVVEVSFDHGYTTPADAAAPAAGSAVFHRRGDWKRLPLTDVPKVIFSEVMRDLDLVVSVAHVGGVDPEATQSTMEMRADLLRETCKLLKLANVKFESRHVLIHGEYSRYSVHLGSGVVHKQPGGSLCVVPVNAQHRGRLFLPFADDDPRTAEVISKVLLLARDKEIQDPTILQQIVGK